MNIKEYLTHQLHCEIAKLNEGWSIFECEGKNQIQAVYDDNVFNEDDAAIRFVLRKAIQTPTGIHAQVILMVYNDDFELINKMYNESK